METLPQSLSLDYQSLEQCLKSTTHFGNTLYTNICNGTQYTVPFGFWEYVLAFCLTAIGISLVVLMLRIVFDY